MFDGDVIAGFSEIIVITFNYRLGALGKLLLLLDPNCPNLLENPCDTRSLHSPYYNNKLFICFQYIFAFIRRLDWVVLIDRNLNNNTPAIFSFVDRFYMLLLGNALLLMNEIKNMKSMTISTNCTHLLGFNTSTRAEKRNLIYLIGANFNSTASFTYHTFEAKDARFIDTHPAFP